MSFKEREAADRRALKLFHMAAQDMHHEFVLLLVKVGAPNTTAHPHMSEREALAMVQDQMGQCVAMPQGARREWLKLAAMALGHVVSMDINAGYVEPAMQMPRTPGDES